MSTSHLLLHSSRSLCDAHAFDAPSAAHVTAPIGGPGRWLRHVAVASVVAMGSLGFAVPQAMAQNSRSATAVVMPSIHGMDVEPAANLEPGAELLFTVWGTPGSTGVLEIAGAQRRVNLVEVRSGVYEGHYTVSRRDRLAPNAAVVANLRRGNQVTTAQLNEPLVQGWQAPETVGVSPNIQRFTVVPAEAAEPWRRRGNNAATERALMLRVEGTPGARAFVHLPGAENRRIRLDETAPGIYTARYVITPADQLRADADARAVLRVGERRTEMLLPRALASNAAMLPMAANPSNTPQVGPMRYCPDCATVLSVNRLQVAGDAQPIGAVAGGLLGAVLGSQVGKGDGRTAAGVAGALGGAMIGHQVDKQRRQTQEQYEVVLRLADGRQETLTLSSPPQVKAGDRVRIVDGRIAEVGV